MDDLNGDQLLDLAIMLWDSGGPREVAVLLGVRAGAFAPPVVVYSDDDSFPEAIAIGDVTGDQVPDLIVPPQDGSAHTVAILPGVGDGTFSAALRFTTYQCHSDVAIADLDGNGMSDLVLASGMDCLGFDASVLVLLNQRNRPGDVDGDGAVDANDFWLLADAFGTCFGEAGFVPPADLDEDGCVTLTDYGRWLQCYLRCQRTERLCHPVSRPAHAAPAKPGTADREPG